MTSWLGPLPRTPPPPQRSNSAQLLPEQGPESHTMSAPEVFLGQPCPPCVQMGKLRLREGQDLISR